MSDARQAIDTERLRAALSPRWARVDVVESTASTNLALLADRSAPDRSVLVAEFQQAGRGRLDRSWTSPPRAGLTFSALVRPAVPLTAWGWLPLLAGVALAEGVRAETGVDVTLKWPNDLLAGPAKTAGVLVQSAEDVAVIGIGLNVSTSEDELPVPSATSLTLQGAADPDRTTLLVAVLTRLDARIALWADCGGDAEACGLAAAYRDACSTLDSPVLVRLADGGVLDGVARGIDPLGRLVVHTDGGERTVGAGDVEHLRPA